MTSADVQTNAVQNHRIGWGPGAETKQEEVWGSVDSVDSVAIYVSTAVRTVNGKGWAYAAGG